MPTELSNAANPRAQAGETVVILFFVLARLTQPSPSITPARNAYTTFLGDLAMRSPSFVKLQLIAMP